MTAEDKLEQVKHIVVVMMENRSFDHMLGYLMTAGMPEVRGLTGAEFNLDSERKRYKVHAFDASQRKVQRKGEALQKRLDPCHSPNCVKRQISRNNKGFVRDYVATREPGFPRELWGVPMGYYTGKDLPTYDHLARTYCVCDAWHSSIPGDTWPNRLYSVAGRAADSVWRGSDLFQRLARLGPLKKLRNVPIYELRAFTRHLNDGDWRWYSHDPATLRAVDARYRDLANLRRDNFAWFDRKQVSFATRVVEEEVLDIVARDSFLDDAVKGQLRKLSWIDPNFVDLSVLDPQSNDDHPPSDVLAGQQFVFNVYDALRKSPNWEDTVLVVTYDEHGGFYDHVPPPAVSDESGYPTLGLRVPTLVVGPRVRNFVCHEAVGDQAWDHTALIRSILLAFAEDPQRAIDEMGGRVKERSAHLGLVLEDKPRTDIPAETPDPEERLRQWRERARAARVAADRAQPSVAPDGAGQPPVLTDFQQEWVMFAVAMREAGLQRGT